MEDISAGDVYNLLDEKLKTQEEGNYHVKYSGDKTEFKLSDLEAQVTNTSFAPSGANEENQLTCHAQITLEVPLSFGWQNLHPMEIRLSVNGGYTPKF